MTKTDKYGNETLYENKFLSLKKTKEGFLYAERRNIDSTATLAYRKTKDGKYEFLIRFQPLVIRSNGLYDGDNMKAYPCPITGSIEEGESPDKNIIHELYEEANVKGVTKENIVHYTRQVASTQSSEIVHNYLVDVTGLSIDVKNNTDGSVWEAKSESKWISQEELKQILENKDNKIGLSSLGTCYDMFLQKVYIPELENKIAKHNNNWKSIAKNNKKILANSKTYEYSDSNTLESSKSPSSQKKSVSKQKNQR